MLQCAEDRIGEFFNGCQVLRGATGLLLSLRAAGLLRCAGAGLFLRAATRCVLCSGAVLWTGVL
jgi:hypothetical protein